jgi:transposase InsO family protein
MNYGTILPGAEYILKTKSISKLARKRLEWLDWYRSHGSNAELTCRHFGISKSVFYRWKNRFNKRNLTSLEGRSTKPKRIRKENTDPQIVDKILALKAKYPRWGKAKIHPVLLFQNPGIEISESSVGRVLKRRGLINIYGINNKHRRKTNCRYIKKQRAKRADRDLFPGHQVQIDVKYYRVDTVWYYRFVAIDTKTRIKFSKVYSVKTSGAGSSFLTAIQEKFPFLITGYQTDNGSEFLDKFHQWTLDNHVNHFFTYAYTPQMNGRVERVIRTDTEEFWDFVEPNPDLSELNALAEEWDFVYNNIRPHMSLGNMTPMAYYASINLKKETVLDVLN